MADYDPVSPAGWLRGIRLQFEGTTGTGILESLEIPPQPRTFLPWRRCTAYAAHRCQRPAGHGGGHYWRRWHTTVAWGWDYPWSIVG